LKTAVRLAVVRVAPVATAVVIFLTACGGNGGTKTTPTTPAAPGTLRAIVEAPGADVALVLGTRDYAPRDVRVTFLLVNDQSRAIFSSGGARFWVAKSLDAKPFATGTAQLEQISVPGASTTDEADVSHLYIARFQVEKRGKYWLVAEPIGAKPPIQGMANVVVAEESKTPAIGEKAYPSRTPTLDTVGGDAEKLTTRNPPDTELLRHSVADSLRDRVPFVLVFATPKFCESRTCGPVVDVADAVRKRIGGDVRFIHVEIYEDNDPQLGTNRWVREWMLPTEPWVFLVGRDGRVKAKFEGAVSLAELEAAVRRYLL
jgi:hypothetical protein